MGDLEDKYRNDDKDYITLTNKEFNEKYSKLFNLQLVDEPVEMHYLIVHIELINKWEKWKEEAENNKVL